MCTRKYPRFLNKSIGVTALALLISALQACGGGSSSLAVTPGSSSNGSDTDIGSGSGSGSGSGAGTSNDSGSGNGSGTANGSDSGTGTGTDNTPTPSGETPVTPVPTVNSVNPATSFNVKGATVLYTTAQAISSAQLNAGLMRSSRALPTFVSGKNAAAKNGLMAGLAGNSNAFNLVAVTSDGISHQAIESPYLSRVLYTVSPSSINQTDERRFVDPNVYIAFSSDPIEGDSNDYSQFILKTANQPCALYYVNTGNNSQGCALPNVEPIPYFGSDFGKVDGSNRKPLQFDSEGNIYVVGKPFTVSNEKIIKKPYARLYKIQRGTFAATPLTQDNESVAFFTVLASGEPVVAISRQTGFDLAVFVTKNGATARRTIASQISDPFINLDTYRTLFYGSSAGNNKAVNIVRTSESNLERAVINYNTGTPTGYNLTVSSTTYSSLIPRRVISGDDGNFYTVFSATSANSDSALLIYQTLPFKRDAVAAIPVTGEWWTWMKNRPLQIKRGVLYYATTQDRANIGSVDIIKVVRLTDGTTQSLFADKNYRIDSWKALGDTLHFSGIDNDTNQVVQGQVNTKKIAQQRDWSASAWQNLIPATVTPSASARASSILVEDLESLAPQQPQTDTGMAPAVLTFQTTDKSAALTFTKYMEKATVESKLNIEAKQSGIAKPGLFPVWGYQNLHLVYDTSNGLSDNQTTGLPLGSGSYQISATDLPDAYGWSIANINYMVTETLAGTYALAVPDSASSGSNVAVSGYTLLSLEDFSNAATAESNFNYSAGGRPDPTPHTFANGTMEIRMDQIDHGGNAAYKTNFLSANKVKIVYDQYMHGTNNYYSPNLTLGSGTYNNQVNLNAVIEFPTSDWYPELQSCDTPNKPQIYTNITTDSWGCIKSFSKNPNLKPSTAYYDKWLTTVVEFNRSSGELTVDIENDGIVDLRGNIPSGVAKYLSHIQYGTYGWWTGHFVRLDNIRIYTQGTVNTDVAPEVTSATFYMVRADSGTQNVNISGSEFNSNSRYQTSTDGINWSNGPSSPIYNNANSLTVPISKSYANGTLLRIRVCSSTSDNANCSSGNVRVHVATEPASASHYSAVGTFSKEECVRDNATGLVWEGKTVTGIRAGTNLYTNFNNYYGTAAQIASSNNAQGYINAVNAMALCGYTNWRLPTKDELAGITDSNYYPSINTTWFPNTQDIMYWASNPFNGFNNVSWGVGFNFGGYRIGSREGTFPVRLVRSSQ